MMAFASWTVPSAVVDFKNLHAVQWLDVVVVDHHAARPLVAIVLEQVVGDRRPLAGRLRWHHPIQLDAGRLEQAVRVLGQTGELPPARMEHQGEAGRGKRAQGLAGFIAEADLGGEQQDPVDVAEEDHRAFG
jgi:hypothetical protein